MIQAVADEDRLHDTIRSCRLESEETMVCSFSTRSHLITLTVMFYDSCTPIDPYAIVIDFL